MKKGTVILLGVVLAMVIAIGLVGAFSYANHQQGVFKTHFGFLPSNTYWMNECTFEASFNADQKMVDAHLKQRWVNVLRAEEEMKKAVNGDPEKYELARSSYHFALRCVRDAEKVANSFGYSK